MSIKTRLLVLITGAVAMVVVAMAALEINSLVATLLEHASERSTSTAQLVKTQVMARTQNLPERLRPQGGSLADLKLAWRRSIESAQRKVEARNFDLRKNVLEYDDVLNKQREIIYAQRRQLLAGLTTVHSWATRRRPVHPLAPSFTARTALRRCVPRPG